MKNRPTISFDYIFWIVANWLENSARKMSRNHENLMLIAWEISDIMLYKIIYYNVALIVWYFTIISFSELITTIIVS